MKTEDLKSFSYLENGEIMFSHYDTIETTKKLKPGIYDVSYVEHPEYRVVLKTAENSEKIKAPIFTDQEKLDSLVDSFFNPIVVGVVDKLGFNHKIGVLLYGKEGTGKSTIVKYYCDLFVRDQGAIIFYIHNNTIRMRNCWDFIRDVRRVQADPIVVVFEEIDMQIKDNKGYLKSLLDGDSSINNCVVFGTTNHLEELPDAICHRPSRFKYVLCIEGIQNEDDVFLVLRSMLDGLCDEKELRKMAKALIGETLDNIKQFCLDKIMSLTPSFSSRPSVGFRIKDKTEGLI